MKNKPILLGLLLFCLVGALAYAVYTYIIGPKFDEKASLQLSNVQLVSDEKDVKKQISVLKENQESLKMNESALRLKVPKTREISQIIKLIEQFESLSETHISNVSFNNYDESAKDTLQKEDQATSEGIVQNPLEENDTEKKDEITNTEPSSPISEKSLPGDVKLVTVALTVSADEEQNIVKFLKEAEKNPRLFRVDSVNYTIENPEEVTSTESDEISTDQTYPVSATVQLTTFYSKDIQ
ncbi:MAG TPA: hypothetical protein DCF99_12965 [Flavobacteriaceae bacterium]|nr:hypothetical protein [Flavobacteriaceae bacterium]